MAVAEYVGPVLASGGLAALVIVVLRYGPDAVLRLVAGLVAVLTAPKDQRSQRCLDVLRILCGRYEPPPSLPGDSDSDSGTSGATETAD